MVDYNPDRKNEDYWEQKLNPSNNIHSASRQVTEPILGILLLQKLETCGTIKILMQYYLLNRIKKK